MGNFILGCLAKKKKKNTKKTKQKKTKQKQTKTKTLTHDPPKASPKQMYYTPKRQNHPSLEEKKRPA